MSSKKIRFIPKTKEKNDPVVRLRCDRIIEALGMDGLDIGYYDQKGWADILVVGSTDFMTWLPVLEENKKKGQIVILDLPENEFRRMAHLDAEKIKGVLSYVHNPFEVWRRFLAHLRRRDFDTYLERFVRLCDHVTVGSEETLLAVSPYNDNCSVIYEPLETGFPPAPKEHAGKARSIIWVGMAVNFTYILEIKTVLEKVMQETGVRLKIITSPDLFKSFPTLGRGFPIDIDFIEWDLETLWDQIRTSDIGIAPLFKYTWKSPNKVATYWAAGLPVVASPSKVYSHMIEQGKNGFVASNEKEWYSSLRALIHEPDLRNRMGKQGYRKAVGNFGIETIAGQWLCLFRELIRKRID